MNRGSAAAAPDGPMFTPAEITRAVWAVLDRKTVSLWLDEPAEPTCSPCGFMHPEDVGHVGRWVAEELLDIHRRALPVGPLGRILSRLEETLGFSLRPQANR